MVRTRRRRLKVLGVMAAALTLAAADVAAWHAAGDNDPGSAVALSARQEPHRGGVGLSDRQRIGSSVEGRPIFAYRVGDPHARRRAVIVGSIHGDEPAGVRLARSVARMAPVAHIDLWVVPTINPDGLSAHVRQNAHGVDLNRNWRHRWVHETGRYDSGPRPFSEPETRAMRRFLDRVDPTFIVSFHQPLHGVDSDAVKNAHLMNRLARDLNLPKKPFRCGGVCHGTMTGWFNAHHDGACITVEFGYHPPRPYLTRFAARGTVRAVLGRFRP